MTEFAGTLRESVGVEYWREARDDSGGDAGAWVAGTVVAAAIAPTDRGAAVAGEGLVSRPRHRVVLRSGVAIDLATRLRWRDRVLMVLRVEADPRAPDRVTVLVEDRT